MVSIFNVPRHVHLRDLRFVKNCTEKIVGAEVSVDEKRLDDALDDAVESAEGEEDEGQTGKSDPKILQMQVVSTGPTRDDGQEHTAE